MTPNKRSTLQLDLKDISSRSAGPNIGRVTLVACSVLVVSIAVASMNIPSDEVATDGHIAFSPPPDRENNPDKKSFKAREVVIAEAGSVIPSSSVLTIPPAEAKANEENTAISEPVITAVLPEKKRKSAFLDNQIQLASLAPIPSARINNPLVNQIETDPVAAATTPLPLSVTVNGNTDAEPIVLANAAPLSSLSNSVLQEIEQSTIEVEEQPSPLLQALPKESDSKKASPAPSDSENDWVKATVQKKDTLSQIFNRLGLSSKEAYRLVKLKGAKPLSKIRPGQVVKVAKRVDDAGNEKLKALRLKVSRFDTLVIEHDESEEKDYRLTTETREPEIRFTTSSATISGSLLGAAKRAGIPYDTVYELATIFGWQVDFSKDIQKGDRFTVVHEELFLDDVKVGNGEVIAAELATGKKKLQAVRHVAEDGHVSYFAPDGDGIQGSFLRSPIKFARVSSKFSKKRFHPIKKKWKAHKGVDYSAPMKTPIRATGDGMVKFAGTKKGYGRTIILRHGGKYETVYAHMNHFKKGLTNGSRIKQGDIIGYVGKTGWTTGPHLHYEFRVNGKHMNPLTVELPKSASIEERYAKAFKQEATKWVAALSERAPISLAQKP